MSVAILRFYWTACCWFFFSVTSARSMGRLHRILIFNVIITFTMSRYWYLYYVLLCGWYQHVVFILMYGWFFMRLLMRGPFLYGKERSKGLILNWFLTLVEQKLVSCKHVPVSGRRWRVTGHMLTFEHVWFDLVIFDTCCSVRVRHVVIFKPSFFVQWDAVNEPLNKKVVVVTVVG